MQIVSYYTIYYNILLLLWLLLIWQVYLKVVLDKHILLQACTISACGNFAILGTAGGWIERFNLQSGISRGSYIDQLEGTNRAHDGEVVGVACDSTNTLMISAGYAGDVKVCKFVLTYFASITKSSIVCFLLTGNESSLICDIFDLPTWSWHIFKCFLLHILVFPFHYVLYCSLDFA